MKAHITDIAPPAGAEADIWEADPPQRVVYTIPECVMNSTGDSLRSPIVTAQAVQRSNGYLSEPTVSVECSGEPGLTSSQARELAAAIVRAADTIDHWVGAK